MCSNRHSAACKIDCSSMSPPRPYSSHSHHGHNSTACVLLYLAQAITHSLECTVLKTTLVELCSTQGPAAVAPYPPQVLEQIRVRTSGDKRHGRPITVIHVHRGSKYAPSYTFPPLPGPSQSVTLLHAFHKHRTAGSTLRCRDVETKHCHRSNMFSSMSLHC